MAYALILELAKAGQRPLQDPVKAAVDFIRGNLGRAITLEEIASLMHVSGRTAVRLFNRHLGEPPLSYHRRQRFGWAQILLKSTAMSVKEVAAAVGIDDPLYFSAQFKRIYGRSPKFDR